MNILNQIFDNAVVFIALLSIVFISPKITNSRKMSNQILIGLFFSMMVVFTMRNGVHLGDGYYIDARYAMPIIAIMFFGFIPGVMVVVTTIVVRLTLGSVGGASTAIIFAVVQLLATVVIKKYYFDKRETTIIKKSIILFVFSLLLQVYLLAQSLLLQPFDLVWPIVYKYGLYVIFVYPVILVIFALIVETKNEQNRNKEQFKVTQEYFETVFEENPNPTALYDEHGKYIKINKAWREKSGYEFDEIIDVESWVKLAYQGDYKESILQKLDDFNTLVKNNRNALVSIKTKSGETKIWEIERKQIEASFSGSNTFISIAKDITEKMEYEEKLIEYSFHDHLTGLYNRRFYDELFKLNFNIELDSISVIYGDMNDLKNINDFYGHEKGDKAIIHCSYVLNKVFKDSDVFRFGGDEFLVVSKEIDKAHLLELIDLVDIEVKKHIIGEITPTIALGIYMLKKGDSLDTGVRYAETRMYEYKVLESTSKRTSTVEVILAMLFEKDPETERHSRRVQQICDIVSTELNLTSKQKAELNNAGLLHDIGKILIPTSILLNKKKLSKEDYEVVQKHSHLGYRILSAKGYLNNIAKIILHHHERTDGTGYPDKLKNDDIPYLSKILCLVDSYEAMTTDRPYRKKLSKKDTINEIIINKGKQFDPELADQFVKLIEDGKIN